MGIHDVYMCVSPVLKFVYILKCISFIKTREGILSEDL